MGWSSVLAAARRGASKLKPDGSLPPANIAEVQAALTALGVEDVGLTPKQVEEYYDWKRFVGTRERLRGVPPVYYIDVFQDSQVQMNCFLVPPGAELPLHDHPLMTVFTKVLWGELQVLSLDWREQEPPSALHTTSSTAVVTEKRLMTEGQVSHLLPQHRNLHQFSSSKGCLFADIFIPPYDWVTRSCTFFSPQPSNNAAPSTTHYNTVREGHELELKALPSPHNYWNVLLPYEGPPVLDE